MNDIYDNLVKSKRNLDGAVHILNVIMPLSQDNKLILKSLEKAYDSLVLCISFILKYEHLKKNIVLSKDKKQNENLFFNKCAKKYGLNEKEKDILREILLLGRKHKESGFEFVKKSKVVIMDDDLKTVQLGKESLSESIYVIRKLITSIHSNLNGNQY